MRNKPVHLGKANQLVNELTAGVEFGTFLLDYMKNDPLNFVQINFADKVDMRMTCGEYEGRKVFFAFFVEAGSAAPAPKGHIQASGLTFFQGHDDQAAVNLFVQIERSTNVAGNLHLMQKFSAYTSKNTAYRLSKDHTLLPAIIYANCMIHLLAQKKGDDKVNANYVNWVVSNFSRDLSEKTLGVFKDDAEVTANRLALALMKNDLMTNIDLSDITGARPRSLVTSWLRDNMAAIKECEVEMADKDFHALAV